MSAAAAVPLQAPPEHVHKCWMCGRPAASHKQNVEHMMGHVKSYLCLLCGQRFQRAQDLQQHTLVHDAPEEVDLASDEEPEDDPKKTDVHSAAECASQRDVNMNVHPGQPAADVDSAEDMVSSADSTWHRVAGDTATAAREYIHDATGVPQVTAAALEDIHDAVGVPQVTSSSADTSDRGGSDGVVQIVVKVEPYLPRRDSRHDSDQESSECKEVASGGRRNLEAPHVLHLLRSHRPYLPGAGPANRRPFKCDHCKGGFSRKDHLVRHLRTSCPRFSLPSYV